MDSKNTNLQRGTLLVHKFTGKLCKIVQADKDSGDLYVKPCHISGLTFGNTRVLTAHQVQHAYRNWEHVA